MLVNAQDHGEEDEHEDWIRNPEGCRYSSALERSASAAGLLG